MTTPKALPRAAACALAAGLLLTAGLPPFGWWPLSLVGAGLLAVVVADRSWRPRAAVGAAAGVGFLAPGLFWMTEFSAPGYVLAVLIESSVFTLGVVAVPATVRGWRWLGFPAGLVLAEGLRGIWPFGGVPIATLAQTQIGGPLAPTVRLGGTLLLAALVGVVGVALGSAWHERNRWATGIALAAVAAVAAAGWVAPHGTGGEEIRVAMVQGGGERGTRDVTTSARAVADRHLVLMDRVPEDVDLVLWPEDVIKVTGDVRGTPADDLIGGLARSSGATLVVGTSERDGDRFRVMSTVWDPDGQVVSRYQKQQRVPFGEYVPFRPLVERLADVSAIPRDSLAGTGVGFHDTPVGGVGVTISFEVFFPSLARAATSAGAELLVVPTNATSYSTTQMPALTLASARLRALESGRYVVQAAPTGFSGVITPSGGVVAQSDLGAPTVLDAAVNRRTGTTPYGRVGDLPFVAAALVALAAAWVPITPLGRRPTRSVPPRSHLTRRSG